jgi:hypothetical protein
MQDAYNKRSLLLANDHINISMNISKALAFDKISTLTKYRFRQVSAKKKYRRRQNIAFDKISLPTKYQRRKNIGDNKISLSTKYR